MIKLQHTIAAYALHEMQHVMFVVFCKKPTQDITLNTVLCVELTNLTVQILVKNKYVWGFRAKLQRVALPLSSFV